MTQPQDELDPPFEIIEPEQWRGPVLFNSPHSGRVARQVKHFPFEPAVSLNPARQKPYFELNVSCADRPGLLSSMARVFLAFEVNLQDARISTLGQRAEDVFIVANKKLGDAAFASQLQAALIGELRAG